MRTNIPLLTIQYKPDTGDAKEWANVLIQNGNIVRLVVTFASISPNPPKNGIKKW